MEELTKQANSFRQLLKFVEEEWEIDEPVLLGAMWRTTPGANGEIYHFILRNKLKGRTTLLSLCTSPQLLAFLSENNIEVISLP